MFKAREFNRLSRGLPLGRTTCQDNKAARGATNTVTEHGWLGLVRGWWGGSSGIPSTLGYGIQAELIRYGEA